MQNTNNKVDTEDWKESKTEQKFITELFSFLESRGVPNLKIPQIGGKELNLHKLYKLVINRGGAETVSNYKMWKDIVSEFDLPSTCTSASYTLKVNYQKYLLAYEQKFHFKKNDDNMVTELESQRQKRTVSSYPNNNNNYTSNDFILNNSEIQTTLKKNLKEIYADKNKDSPIFYISKKRMTPHTSEIQRISLAFESRVLSEIKYSLNSLLLLSCSKNSPFYIVNYKPVFYSLVAYFNDTMKIITKHYSNNQTESELIKRENYSTSDYYILPIYSKNNTIRSNNNDIYSSNNITYFEEICFAEVLDQFKIMLLIIRNLYMLKLNEEYISNNITLTNLFYFIFINDLFDGEINSYILDILNIKSRVTNIGSVPNNIFKQFMNKLVTVINSENIEEYENGLEIFNNMLMNQSSEVCLDDMLKRILDTLVKNILSNSIEIIENTIGILIYFSDLSIENRLCMAKHKSFFPRLIGIIAGNNNKATEKIGKFACLIITNVCNTPASKNYISPYIETILNIYYNDTALNKYLEKLIKELKINSEMFKNNKNNINFYNSINNKIELFN